MVRNVVTVAPIPISLRRSSSWQSTTKPTAKSGLSCCLGYHSNRGPISGAGTSQLTTASCILCGLVGPPVERKALLALAESVLWVSQVCDEMLAAYKAGSPI
jgi:hypothetical protein